MKEWVCTTEQHPWQQGEKRSMQTDAELVITNERLQTVRGFGGCFNELGAIAIKKLPLQKQETLLDEFFASTGCGFRFCRFPIGANDYAANWYSYDEVDGDFELRHFSIERDRKYLLPFIQEGLARNPQMELFASPWSPPVWMKFPQAHNYGMLVWDKRYLDAYARYFVKFIQAYEAEGIHVDQLHIQNEPCSSQKFPSCVWSGAQFTEFIRDYLAPAFFAAGLDTAIWLGTINGPEVDDRALYTRYSDYVGLVLEDAVCRAVIKGVSYQWAGKYAMQVTHEAFPELELIQSESECGDGANSWAYALYIMEMLIHYFRNGASAYVYWNMALLPGGESTWGWKQNSLVTIADGNVCYNPEFYVMKHLSHFVKRGARRLKTQGRWTAYALAFENPDGERVVVLMNPYGEEKRLTVAGEHLVLPPRSIHTVVL